MEIRKVSAAQGWSWLGEAWRLFRRDPGIWILIGILYSLGMLILSQLPFVGHLATIVLGPLLTAGIMLACHSVAAGGAPGIGALAAGFRHERTGTLVVMALAGVAGTVAVLLLAAILAVVLFYRDYVALMVMVRTGSLDLSDPLVTSALLRGIFVATVGATGYTVVVMFTWFAPLGIVFGNLNAGAAMKKSFEMCITNVGALTVYGLLILFLAIVAAVPLGFGLLVWLPVTMIAPYFSYRDMVGETATNDQAPAFCP